MKKRLAWRFSQIHERMRRIGVAPYMAKWPLDAVRYNELIKMDLELIKEWLIHISNEHLN